MAFCRLSLFRHFPNSFVPPLPTSPFTLSRICRFSVSASASTRRSPVLSADSATADRGNRWKPMCLYYTQGKCTKMEDPTHMESFNHNCSVGLLQKFRHLHHQPFDFFLVLDLEGKVEILEFPVLMIDSNTMDVVDFFHRFVRPSEMSEERIAEYIKGKYGKIGVDRVWHDTAIPFREVIEEFEAWTAQHHSFGKELGRHFHKAAFVTCGNWDVKTKIPQQCRVAKIELPPYFMEWINLKDVYLNFYKRRATGMLTMMRELRIPMVGSHHLGIDDAMNITRVLQRMIADGAVLQVTARRNPDSPEKVEYLFKNRV